MLHLENHRSVNQRTGRSNRVLDDFPSPADPLSSRPVPRPSKNTVLALLSRKRLLRLASLFELELAPAASAEELTAALDHEPAVTLEAIIGQLNATEIRQLCTSHEIDPTGDKDTDAAALLATVRVPARATRPRAPKPKTAAQPKQPEPKPKLPEPAPLFAPTSEPNPAPTPVETRTILQSLTHARIGELARDLGVVIPTETATKPVRAAALLQSSSLALGDALAWMTRDELKLALRTHGLDDSGRSRTALAGRLRAATGATDTAPNTTTTRTDRSIPVPGEVVRVRHRQWLVDAVTPPPLPRHATRVGLVCLDDDDPGRELEVLWELELGARVMVPETHGLGTPTALDPPRHFAAYLHALEWSSVTATEAKLFQAPFRAGIRLMNHQLAPLKKALELPRANLFVADDVGLGKTIEAGLVLQELLLRQRVDFVLVVCPASVCLQWRGEMQRRFGLHFEIHNRTFVGLRRQQRGFAVNPWATHNRFIISYQLLRRPEYRDPLLQHLEKLAGSSGDGRRGEKARKSLLILDEAHTAAPASASKYAVDSRVTNVIRDVTQRFENRLFLSATPHNGHTNSFAALLELLDPQRFTRTFQPRPALLRSVMVRRLKGDIPAGEFPERKVIAVNLEHRDGHWWQTTNHDEAQDLGPGPAIELELADKLRAYAKLCKPKNKRGRLVFVNLQKRLLSNVEAFWRTLGVHAQAVGEHPETWLPAAQIELISEEDDSEYGEDDDNRDELDAATLATSSRALDTPQGRARELLDEMLELARVARIQPDAKLLALLTWIRAHQCPAVTIGGVPSTADADSRRWTDTRVLIFTEYGDTKRWLVNMLAAAVAGTDRGDERIMQFHGGMSDEQRDEVQRAFNGPPEQHPVRILVCTDAAREGINLHGHCADLFHFDIPWNPARMEQRNGRIDRALHSSPEVRCHYFVLPQRSEDAVLRTLVSKVGTIRQELGSLGAIIMEQMAELLEARGIDDDTATALESTESLGGRRETVAHELERQRDQDRIKAEIVELGRLLNASAKLLRFDPALLRDAIDVGLELAGAPAGLREDDKERGLYHLPELPDSWNPTLDTMRPTRGRDESFWDWRRHAPLPIVFDAPKRLDGSRVHMHLSHPLTQRVLSRFLAQGFGAHDLSRVTVVRNRHDHLARVIAFGRLTLFGPGAARLHDQLVTIGAPWLDDASEGHLQPFEDAAERDALDMLERALAETPTLNDIAEKTRKRLLATASADFAALWPHVETEAESIAHDAGQKLTTRGVTESAALREILETQRADIQTKIAAPQLMLDATFSEAERAQREQVERDREYLESRIGKIQHELDTEPEQIRALYQVTLRRLEPVGLVYLWPSTRS